MRRAERLLRAGAAACVSTFSALGLHVAAGEAVPAAPGVVVPLLIAFTVAAQLAGVALSRWRLAVTVGTSQLAFHALFLLGSRSSVTLDAGHDVTHGAHLVASHAGEAHTGHGPAMTAAHVGAAIATYAVLRRADVLLGCAARVVEALLTGLAARSAPAITPLARVVTATAPAQRPALIITAARTLRGPPLLPA